MSAEISTPGSSGATPASGALAAGEELSESVPALGIGSTSSDLFAARAGRDERSCASACSADTELIVIVGFRAPHGMVWFRQCRRHCYGNLE